MSSCVNLGHSFRIRATKARANSNIRNWFCVVSRICWHWSTEMAPSRNFMKKASASFRAWSVTWLGGACIKLIEWKIVGIKLPLLFERPTPIWTHPRVLPWWTSWFGIRFSPNSSILLQIQDSKEFSIYHWTKVQKKWAKGHHPKKPRKQQNFRFLTTIFFTKVKVEYNTYCM